MKKRLTLILERRHIEKVIDVKPVIAVVEKVFKCYARNKTQMPSKVYLTLPQFNGDFRAMPAFVDGFEGCVLKWVNVHPDNQKIGLPTVMGIMILSDPKTGFPLCIMDGTYATAVRTAAAGAVAAKYLANPQSSVVALVGCGVQAVEQLRFLNNLFPISEARVWGKKILEAEKFVSKERGKYRFSLRTAKTVKESVQNADIVVTTTPSRKPLVQLAWLKPGVHINAIGADAKGKQELESMVLKKARIIIDDWDQASHSGEINVPLTQKVISRKNIAATLSQIVMGQKRGRQNQTDITVFDSTGLGIQDVAIANLVYKTAIKLKRGKSIQMI